MAGGCFHAESPLYCFNLVRAAQVRAGPQPTMECSSQLGAIAISSDLARATRREASCATEGILEPNST
jgi:hypothetical protein